VIRGPNVTPGYESNPTANASAFHDGWFRTGDEGVLDDQGYLRLTGRLKEIINRAGEKITPIEVDNVLMEHPSVRQVVTFAMPSRTFGEDVAAAVVLHDGAEADPEILRAFVATRLAAFKVPRKIVFLEEIPKGATGKLQRIGLAQRLGVED
jgi:acyl-CoA synthetase (AMP-forming)/AMP-acid ligase II